MPHVTSIGLDVHARSVAAAAFNPFTGEVVHRDFGTDAAEIAEWALGFEEPRACYESGPTGFHMARELRALGLDCAVAAVSKMQRPAADARRKNDRRDAEFIARMLATHNIVEVPLPDAAVEAARDLDRALDDATAEYRRARQRLNMFLIRLGHVWDERNADGARKGSWTRAHWRWISGIRLEGPQRDVLEYYVTAARCAESDRRQLEKKVLALARTDRWRPAVEALSCIKGIDGLATLMWTVPGGARETGGPYMRDPRHPRHFTDEFKRQIVDLYNAGKPKREIMDEYDLGKSTVERWIKSINATGSPRAADNRTPEQNRILELERENRRLRMEVDVLKQAAPICARK